MTLRALLCALALVLSAGGAAAQAAPGRADPLSDAPEQAITGLPYRSAASYDEALRVWQGVDELNAWIGAHFRYDMARAMLLSETQRQQGGSLPITAPARFFDAPNGVCVDLSRFGVETLRALAPQSKPSYLMIEFAPVTIQGNTLRRHWVASFERAGQLYFFADSKRPGHIAGPYASAAAYIADYARYRGREIVAHRVLPSYEKQRRAQAQRQSREDTASK